MTYSYSVNTITDSGLIVPPGKNTFFKYLPGLFLVKDHTCGHNNTGGKNDKEKNAFVEGRKLKLFGDLIKKHNGN